MTHDDEMGRIRSTTVVCVRKDGRVALGADGQVSMGPTVMKGSATKVRTLAKGRVLAGFAGSAADGLTLCELLEAKLEAQERSLRQLGHLVSMLHPGDTWTSIGVGKYEMPLAYMAIAMGGHVRVGLEDSLWLGPGQLAPSSAAQVLKIREVLDALSVPGECPPALQPRVAMVRAGVHPLHALHQRVGAPASALRRAARHFFPRTRVEATRAKGRPAPASARTTSPRGRGRGRSPRSPAR